MSGQFFSHRVSGSSRLGDFGIDPANHPFCTDAYAIAMRQLGYECWALGIRADGAARDAAIGVVRRGRVSATLEISSLPAAARESLFWDGVYALSRHLRITDLVAGTFGSPGFVMPPLRGEIFRKERVEYVLAADSDDFEARLSSNHRKNIKKARAAGLTLRHGSSHPDSAADHARMIGHSRERRAARGEQLLPGSMETAEQSAYLLTGAGEVYQAVHKGCVVSSLLVLRSARTGYCQSTGTSPEGREVGASHFLFHSVCRELYPQGVRTINLGGAPEGSSLAEFKAGFGATGIILQECACYIGPAWLKKLRSCVRLARTDRAQFWKLLSGDSYRMLVYVHPAHAAMPAIPAPAGARFQILTEDDLAKPVSGENEAEFRRRQLGRLRQFGAAHAYGVYSGEKLAHVSWLLPPAAVAQEQPKFLDLQDGDAEITGSETLPGYRGKGLYPFAIQQIIQVAEHLGIRRIYMKARKENLPSQAGILRAGLRQTGVITVVTPPAISSKTFILRRFRTAL